MICSTSKLYKTIQQIYHYHLTHLMMLHLIIHYKGTHVTTNNALIKFKGQFQSL